MNKEILKQWEKNKNKLQKYFETTNQEAYTSYEKILKAIIKYVLNKTDDYWNTYDTKIKVIDDGEYQGTQIFIIHRNVYQPSVNDYLYTYVYYGSCSGCDTLQSIEYSADNYGEGLPTKKQVKDYMLLALHLVQNLKTLKEQEENK